MLFYFFQAVLVLILHLLLLSVSSIMKGDIFAIDESAIKITLHDNPPAPLKVATPGLKHFTPHMLRLDWDSVTGWSAPIIEVRQKLALDPASSVLHYGTSCFEG